MDTSWITPSIFSIIGTLLVAVVLLYLRGVAKDVFDLKLQTQEITKQWDVKLDIAIKEMRVQAEKQGEKLSQVQIEMAKMQEQLYSILRGTHHQQRQEEQKQP